MNPFLGVFLLTVAGLMGGSFYVPFCKVKTWSWETYWLIMAAAAWLAFPLLAAFITVPDLPTVFVHCPVRSLILTSLFGAMWGVGAVATGLAMRYLGISLGMTVVVGLYTAFGTLVPPLVDGQFGRLLTTVSGQTVLLGVLICLLGVVLCGCAGSRKERELTDEQKRESVKEFAVIKGFILAAISGVMSAGLFYGLHAGQPIAQAALALGTPEAYQNGPVLLIILASGFAVNAVFCLTLGVRNRSMRQYVAGKSVLLLGNYALVGLAGVLWYSQIFIYGMATTKMGEYAFVCCSILTALITVFSMLWGLVLKEWTGVRAPTWLLLWSGIAVLVLSAVVMGVGSSLDQHGPAAKRAAAESRGEPAPWQMTGEIALIPEMQPAQVP